MSGGRHLQEVVVGPDRRRISPALVVSILALVLAVAGGAYAAGSINGAKLKNRSVAGKKLKKNTVTGTEVKESRLGQVPSAVQADSATNADHATNADTATNATQLNGKPDTAYMGSAVERVETGLSTGTALGNTDYIDKACPAGEILLSGGPANVNDDSVMVESFPTPGGTNSWRARIRAATPHNDMFSVVALCAHR
jgi:hypothetical protein